MLPEMDWLTQSEGPANSALLFEMMAEAVRSPTIAKTLRAFSRQLRRVLADVVHQGQTRGEIDKAIDPDTAAVVLIGIMDALRALAVRYPDIDTSEATDVFKLLTTRFLSEGIAKGARSRKTRLQRSTVGG